MPPYGISFVIIIYKRTTLLLQELIVELLPSPQRCLDRIHELLPQLASEVYQAFIAEVCC